jgi:hypothetical protein
VWPQAAVQLRALISTPAANHPQQRRAYLRRQMQKLHPGCTITITICPPEPLDQPALTGTAAA